LIVDTPRGLGAYGDTAADEAATERPSSGGREFQMQTINAGRYGATIRNHIGSFYVIITRDGDCLPGVAGRFYASAKSAETGARKMLAKAAA